MSAEQALRFLHIPKTAGSSFNECLFALYLRAYLQRRLFVFSGNIRSDLDRFHHLPARTRARIILYSGHAPYNTGAEAIDRVRTITFLRDPVQRVISLCLHFLEGKSPKVKIEGGNTAQGISAFLDSGRTQLSNFQTKVLLGRGNFVLPRGSENEIVDRAMEVLEHRLAAFGLTEEFDLSLMLFQQALGWKRTPLYRVRNEKSRQLALPLTDAHMERIAELNHIDALVYERACETFQARVQPLLAAPAMQPEQLHRRLTRGTVRFAAIDLSRAWTRYRRSREQTSRDRVR